jgi:transposase
MKPIKYTVRLTLDERKMLFEHIEKGKASKEKLNRARILLKADCGEKGENLSDKEIANAFYVSTRTVLRVRQSLVEEGLEATLNRKLPKTRKRRIIEGEEESYLIALTCSDSPQGQSKWTLRMLADKMIELEYVDSVSHETIRTALKKTNSNHGKKKNGVSPLKKMQSSSAKWKKS